jgi:intracellular sulfur oxidation DsrE/DsrF family protein
MIRFAIPALLAVLALSCAPAARAEWPAPAAPAIPEADGYVAIPNAPFAPDGKRVFRAVWDATRAADTPTGLVPALNMAGSELNALGASGVPLTNAKFVVVFHGAAMDGLLDDAHYRAKFGTANPNLKVIATMKKEGVAFYVCGQNLAFARIDPKTLTPDVTVASDALLVLMVHQNDGYALMSF